MFSDVERLRVQDLQRVKIAQCDRPLNHRDVWTNKNRKLRNAFKVDVIWKKKSVRWSDGYQMQL